MVIFGVLAFCSGVMALWLPETLFSPMPQTVEQVEAWPEDYQNYCCKRSRARADESEDQVGVALEENGTA